MNKYFIQILRDRTLLIIPKFGALTVASRKTGKIVFNANLTFDDNVLSNYIAEKEGIDKIEAKNTIAKFVREIEAILDKGETYDIYQFGKFFKNDKGEIVFESELNSIEKSDIVEIPKEETKAVETPKEEVKKEEQSENSNEEEDKKENVYIPPVLDKVKDKTEEVVKETKDKVTNSVEDIKNKYKKTDKKVTKEVKDTKDKTKTVVASTNDDIKNEFKKKSTEKPKKDKTKAKDGEKKKRSKLPLILLLLLLIGGGVAGYLNQDKIKEMLGMNKTEQHEGESNEHAEDVASNENEHQSSDENVQEDEVGEEALTDETTTEEEAIADENTDETAETIEEEVVEETTPEPAATVQSSVNGNYHVIGGAFGEEANATRFAEKTGGTVLGKFNGLYQVAIKSYDTRSDANAGLKQLSSEYPSAWILKYSK